MFIITILIWKTLIRRRILLRASCYLLVICKCISRRLSLPPSSMSRSNSVLSLILVLLNWWWDYNITLRFNNIILSCLGLPSFDLILCSNSDSSLTTTPNNSSFHISHPSNLRNTRLPGVHFGDNFLLLYLLHLTNCRARHHKHLTIWSLCLWYPRFCSSLQIMTIRWWC